MIDQLLPAYYAAAQGVGLRYYETSRLNSGIETPYNAVLGPDIPPTALANSLGVTGPTRYKQLVDSGTPPNEAVTDALDSMNSMLVRRVQDGSRLTVVSNVMKDDKAYGWQRLSATGHPCAFCALLISRGPVYKSQASADFQAHDKCSCFAEPFYTSSAQAVPVAQEYQELYKSSTEGYSGQAARNAFRRAYEAKYRPKEAQ